MPYADVSQYVLASEAIPEIARCYFGGDTSKAESDARIAAQEGALPVFLGSLFLQYIRRDRWYHDHIHWSSINEPLYFPRADLLKIYPDLWRSLQSPDNETTLIAVPEGAPDSDTAQSDAIDVDTSGSDQTDAEIDVTQGDTREAEQDEILHAKGKLNEPPPVPKGRRRQTLAVQGFVDDQVERFRKKHKRKPTLDEFDQLLADSYFDRDGSETGHPNCDEVVYLDKRLTWTDSAGNRNSDGLTLQALKRYLTRAKAAAPRN